MNALITVKSLKRPVAWGVFVTMLIAFLATMTVLIATWHLPWESMDEEAWCVWGDESAASHGYSAGA